MKMSLTARKRSEEFLKISSQFRLGDLTTEASHPATANLSELAQKDAAAGLGSLFTVDLDVLNVYRRFVESGRAAEIKTALVQGLERGGRIFFTGCGSTGRLSIQLVSIWRGFWRRHRALQPGEGRAAEDFESRAFSVMAGGDFALIKAVEGFEDFAEFGKKQMSDLGVTARDVVFAITEGGETSFVIGTAWKGVEVGARVYFVYNNPDEVLGQHVNRSAEVIREPKIEKINLTTGPMAITGSTRMQATSIQLCVLLTVLEMVVRELRQTISGNRRNSASADPASAGVPDLFREALSAMHALVSSRENLEQLARLVVLETETYRVGHRHNYFADHFAIDVLTDTTERSPTYCTPAFRKFDDRTATESWAFLFAPEEQTEQAWKRILQRSPQCVEWSDGEINQLVEAARAKKLSETVGRISHRELLRFKIGLDGLSSRPPRAGDSATAIIAPEEAHGLLSPEGFYRTQLERAAGAGARVGAIYLGPESAIEEIRKFLRAWKWHCCAALLPVPKTDFLLEGVTRVALKLILNAISTCMMVRLGRVMGNYMIWVVPSNLKLMDRATRYIQRLCGLDYAPANQLLFDVIEYVEPRIKADQAYPPVVGMAVLRARHGLGNAEAEERFWAALKHTRACE